MIGELRKGDLDNCVYGDVKFLYVAPERLASEAFRLRVQRMNVSLLAVDETNASVSRI